MSDKIYILLPVHNRISITRNFIRCLLSQSYKNFHLILIDDGSTDGTEEMVQKEIGSCTVIKGNGHWWWAGSLQQGYLWLKSRKLPLTDLALIINDDTEIEPDFLKNGLAILEKRKKTLLLAQSYNLKKRTITDVGVRANWRRITFTQADKPEQINCLSTRGLFVRIGDFFEIGGFYPALLPHYLSDYEFTIRAHRKGLTLMTHPSLRIWVNEETTGYREIGSRSFIEHLKKNFSQKSMSNPVAWTNFIALACPWPWKITGWLIVWKRSLFQTVSDLRGKS
jgi:GT2 family glycosyltransferase